MGVGRKSGAILTDVGEVPGNPKSGNRGGGRAIMYRKRYNRQQDDFTPE
jgi:hypothetical protein